MPTTPEPAGEAVPVGPSLSMFDPIYLGIDEFGEPVYLHLVYRNLLAGGEPGGGKSGLLNTIAAHAALSTDTRLVLFDGKLVELGMWEQIADEFVGPDITHALTVLRRLQQVMNNRYAWLRAHGRRKLDPTDQLSVITAIVDEIAFYSATVGSKQEQEEFVALLRDLVARGRAAGIPVVAATQPAVIRHHPHQLAGPVRLPRRVPLHHPQQLQHRARAPAGPNRATPPPTSRPPTRAPPT